MLIPSKITDYKSQYSVRWKLSMPSDCPPEDIEIPDNHNFMRLTHDINGKLIEDDLLTYSEIYPDKHWDGKMVESYGLSLITSVDKAKALLKLPNIRKQNLQGIAEICLTPTDGVVKQTGGKEHYTWWQTTLFNISNHHPINS